MFALILALFACSNDGDNDTSAEVADGAAVEIPNPANDVFELLQGNFDSSAQAATDPSFFGISLKMCAFEMPELGERVLYVEQASLEDLQNPYRQRIYRVDSAEDRVASHVYAIETSVENAMVGACNAPDEISVSIDQIVERTGCTVWLTQDEDGAYSGGTEGTECRSTLGGAAYATSSVYLSQTTIESWDQGWDSDANHVWGAISGPYIFDRLD